MTTLRIAEPRQRQDLAVFVDHALRLDPAAVIRLRVRTDGLVGAWVLTGFDVLAARVVAAGLEPPDVTCAADQLAAGLRGEAGIDPGLPMDSAWRGALPPETGFVHLDDIPAAVLTELARRAGELAREHSGPQGPPPSLLDQDVLEVSGGGQSVAVPMRCVLTLTAMGFLPADDGEVVRVRVAPAWLRVDARFGSVFRRRGGPALLV